jgi:hypothetical protein
MGDFKPRQLDVSTEGGKLLGWRDRAGTLHIERTSGSRTLSVSFYCGTYSDASGYVAGSEVSIPVDDGSVTIVLTEDARISEETLGGPPPRRAYKVSLAGYIKGGDGLPSQLEDATRTRSYSLNGELTKTVAGEDVLLLATAGQDLKERVSWVQATEAPDVLPGDAYDGGIVEAVDVSPIRIDGESAARLWRVTVDVKKQVS